MKILVRFFSLVFLIISTFQIAAQSPGNIGTTHLTTWLKADSLALGIVTTWTTSFPKNALSMSLIDVSSPFPQANLGLNYNTQVDFSGNTTASLQALEYTAGAINLLDNSNAMDQGTFFAVYYLPPSAACSGCHVLNYREAASGTVDGIQFRVNLNNGIGRLAIGSGNSSNASRDFTQDFKPDIIAYSGNRSAVGTMSAYKRSLLFTGGNASGTTGVQGLILGARKFGANNYNAVFDGTISEIIFFNKDLTAQELAKVHAYLAIKYGISLDATGGGTQGDYLATDGALIWDASENPAYHNEIMGIGRDDNQAFLQKQSHSFDDTTKIYVGNLAASNLSNSGLISSDVSYLIMGNNNGKLAPTSSANLEIPAGTNLETRLEREWKLTNTRFKDTFSLDLISFSSQLRVNDLRLLVDDDGDFTNATIYDTTSGLNFSFANGVVSVTGISTSHFPENATKYFTLGSVKDNTSISDLNQKIFKIYPNPSNNLLFIESQKNIELESIKIYNLLGQDLSNLVNINQNNPLNFSIDLSHLSPGFYTIKINNVSSKILKQ